MAPPFPKPWYWRNAGHYRVSLSECIHIMHTCIIFSRYMQNRKNSLQWWFAWSSFTILPTVKGIHRLLNNNHLSLWDMKHKGMLWVNSSPHPTHHPTHHTPPKFKWTVQYKVTVVCCRLNCRRFITKITWLVGGIIPSIKLCMETLQQREACCWLQNSSLNRTSPTIFSLTFLHAVCEVHCACVCTWFILITIK